MSTRPKCDFFFFEENLVAQGFKRSSHVFGLDTVHKTGQYGQAKHISWVSKPYWYQNSCLRVGATAWETSHYFRTSLQLLLASVLPDSPVGNPKVNKAYLVCGMSSRNTMLIAVRKLTGKALLSVFWVGTYCVIAGLLCVRQEHPRKKSELALPYKKSSCEKILHSFCALSFKSLGSVQTETNLNRIIIALSFGRF